jgi:tetratricopeptide (TPR) repeat protein
MFRQLYKQRIISLLLLTIVFLSALSLSVKAQEDPDEEIADPVAIFNQGQDAHEKGDLEAALKFYEQALKIVPEFPEAEYQRGNVFLVLGKPDEAEKAFRRAVELRPDWSLPMASLGSVLVRKNQFDEAEKILAKAIQLNEQNSPALTALAELKIKTKAKPEILRELLEKLTVLSTKANPTASVWASRAALESALGDKAAAKNSLNRALVIDPRNQSALADRIEIALTEGDINRAADLFKTLQQISPNSSDTRILNARILADSGKSDEALKILDAIENPSTDVKILRSKITASGSENVAELEKQLENDRKNAAILGRLCSLLRAENPGKAVEYCRRASEAEPQNINHAIGFGAALVQAKRFEDAANLFRKLSQFAPDNFTVRANLATALFQLKRYGEAKTEYLWLTEKQPDLAITYYFLGISFDQLGEYLDAMANYQQFLRLADTTQNKLEIEKVNLRLPVLQKQIKEKKGKKNG